MFLFGLQYCLRSGAVKKERLAEFICQDGAGFQTGTVRDTQLGNFEILQCFDCFIHLDFIGADKVRAADHSVDLIHSCNFLRMQDSIDQTPMAASQ